MKIKVLGIGCKRCRMLEENVKRALDLAGVKADIEKVQDYEKIAEYGVISTPALVIDSEIVCQGSIPEVEELRRIVEGAK
ncbi:MAG: thioredoxin family protein [Candidatus Anstonellales archaeon]